MKSSQAQNAFATRHEQIKYMTDPITQQDHRDEVLGMIGELTRELTRIDGEIENHNQFERTQIEALKKASLQRDADTDTSEGTPAMRIESRVLEEARESNKALLVSRRKDIVDSLRAAELYNAVEQKDQEKAAEILADSKATGMALGESKAKALQLIDRYNNDFVNIEKTREVAQNVTSQFEATPGADIARKNMASLMNNLREFTQELENILTFSR